MTQDFFTEVKGPIPFGGLDSNDPLSYKIYDPDRIVLGKRMEDQLRISVAVWHSFASGGKDVFGGDTFDRPWLKSSGDPLAAERAKLDAAFEFVVKLGVPFYCFHDHDISPEGKNFAESKSNLEAMVDYAGEQQARTGVKLLWGTANLFAHPRYAAGAATNPDPDVFAYADAQVKLALDATNKLEGFFGLADTISSHTGVANCAKPLVPSRFGGPCTNVNKHVYEWGETHKFNLQWQIDDADMLYATYSTGFRPGGVNRVGSLPPYQSDSLTNYEIGWKTRWWL